MSLVLLLSIVIRIIAIVYSVILLRRIRDWRIGFLTVMLILMTARQSMTLYQVFERWDLALNANLTEIPGLIVSIMAFLVVHLFYKIITEAREREPRIEESESRYSLLATNVRDVIWTVNMHSELTYVSPSVKRLIGYTPEEMLRLDLTTFATPETIENILHAPIFESGSDRPTTSTIDWIRTLNVELFHKNGSIVPVEILLSVMTDRRGEITGLLGVSRDISARKAIADKLLVEQRHAQERIAIVQEQQSAIMQIALHPSVTGGDLEGACRMITEVIARTIDLERVSIWMLNQEHTEMRCMDLYLKESHTHEVEDMLTASDFPNYFDALTTDRFLDAYDAWNAPRTSEFRESYLEPKDIRTLLDAPIRVHGRPIGVICHEPIGNKRHWEADELSFAGAVADQIAHTILIAEQNETHKHERELERQLLQSQKLESLGTFAGGIAHDFNNLLQAIIGYCDILGQIISPEDTDQMKAVGEIEKAGLRAADLVQQILTFSRRTEVVFRPVDLEPFVREYVAYLRDSLPDTISVDLSIAPSCRLVLGDPTQLHQVVSNICTNAFHAMETTGGRLSIAVEPVRLDLQLDTLSGVLSPGEYNRVEISDTGTGVDPAIFDRLLEPFFTTKEVGRGTGLGLAMVHGILNNMYGGLLIRSELKKGTTVSIFFPIAADVPEIHSIEAHSGLRVSGMGNILIVDDEESICTLLDRGLTARGFRSSSFSKFNECLELLKDDSVHFDAAVLDYTMPGMTGIELARRLAILRPGLPIILITGLLDDSTIPILEVPGIVEVVKKPFDLDLLAQALNRLSTL